MAESNAMDRAQISALLDKAQHTINLAEQAQEAKKLFYTPLSVQVKQRGVFSSASGVVLIPPAEINWPENLFQAIYLKNSKTRLVLVEYISSADDVDTLCQQVRDARGGWLSRLFNPSRKRTEDQAALTLSDKIDEISQQATEVTAVLNELGSLYKQQNQGFDVSRRATGRIDQYVEIARKLLSEAVAVSTPQFDRLSALELTQACRAVESFRKSPNPESDLKALAEKYVVEMNRERVHILMRELPVDALRTATSDRLRFGSLDSIRVTSVADVLDVSPPILMSVSGIGEQTARRMKAAAQTLKQEAESRQSLNIGENPTRAAQNLVHLLARYEQITSIPASDIERRDRVIEYVNTIPPSFADYIVVSDGTKNSKATLKQFQKDLAWVQANPHLFGSTSFKEPPEKVWEDYLKRPAHYQGLLSTLLGRDVEGADELLDKDILQRIRNLKLDTKHVNGLHLRGYQSFGARFAIVQKKVLLGDDMGLGKTVQAITVAAHLAAIEKNFRTLVVVPASVLVNWARESKRFVNLPVFLAHGVGKQQAINDWSKTNGIAVCTFEGVRTMNIPAPGLVIVDEAHMIKNPETKRTQALRTIMDAAPYTLLMTGTPIENKVDEFVNLISYLQPDLISQGMAAMRADDFRARIAPAYLRRNQTDVLDELPERTDTIDWIELTDEDRKSYDEQVLEGSWMGMRRSPMLSPTPKGPSAKMERIIELLDESEEHGRKALIFTYFIDVLDELEAYLGKRVIGRISGKVPASKRQELVDALSNAQPGSALIAQIGAGGVGLNIQTASVCIICEPQIKPSIEHQAVARVHRMGQTATVQIHRLVGERTADERMLEILAGKDQIFDVYARLSDSAEVPDAVDVTETQLATQIIEAERTRLGFEPKKSTESNAASVTP